MSEVAFTSDPTFEEFAQGYAAVIPRRVPIVVWISIGVALGGSIFFTGVSALAGWLLWAVAGIYAGICLWAQWAGTRALVKRMYDTTTRYGPAEYVFSSEGVGVRTRVARSEFAWELVDRVIERPNVLVLAYSRSCLIVPKRAIPPGESGALRDLLDANVKHR